MQSKYDHDHDRADEIGIERKMDVTEVPPYKQF